MEEKDFAQWLILPSSERAPRAISHLPSAFIAISVASNESRQRRDEWARGKDFISLKGHRERRELRSSLIA